MEKDSDFQVLNENTILSDDVFESPWTPRFNSLPRTWYGKMIADAGLESSEHNTDVENFLQPVAGIEPAAHGIPSPGQYRTTGSRTIVTCDFFLMYTDCASALYAAKTKFAPVFKSLGARRPDGSEVRGDGEKPIGTVVKPKAQTNLPLSRGEAGANM